MYKNIGKILSNVNEAPPIPWQIKNSRQQRASQQSIKWLNDTLKWHVRGNSNAYKQLQFYSFEQNKKLIYDYFNWKKNQLNCYDTHELQQKASLSNWQMKIIQRSVKKKAGIQLFPHEHDRRTWERQYDLNTAQVDLLQMQVTSTLVNTRKQMPMQELPVYHADLRDAIQILCNSILWNSRFNIQRPLSHSHWILEIGWDKSDGGIAESVALSITPKYHGKYGSIITTLTGGKVDENYTNYREILNHWNKQNTANQLLKHPNIITVCFVNKSEDGNLKSMCMQGFLMMLENDGQQMYDLRSTFPVSLSFSTFIWRR